MNVAKVVKNAVVALVVAVALTAVASSARADYWQYSGFDGFGNYRAGDTFYRAVDGFWYETSRGRVINQFRQVPSTDGVSFLLQNTANGSFIWIYGNQTHIELPLGSGKRFYAWGQYYVP